MPNRGFMLVIVMVLLLSAGEAFAGDSSWQTCQTNAEALCQIGEWAEAYQKAKSALGLSLAKYGPWHLNTAKSFEKLGEICMVWGRRQQAELYLDRAIKIRSRIHGDSHPSVIRLITLKADQARQHRDLDRAAGLYKKALQLAEGGGWTESSYTAPALEGLARLHLERGEYSSAEQLYEKATAIYAIGGKYRVSERLSEARSLVDLAEIKRYKGDFIKARELYDEALSRCLKIAGPASPMIPLIYGRLGDLCLERGIPSLAVSYFQRSLGAFYRTGLPEGAQTAATLVGLANAFRTQGKPDMARDLYGSAAAIYKRTGGLDRELATTILAKERIWPVR
jgi:tetratricopeptide (TPR) repeat protein